MGLRHSTMTSLSHFVEIKPEWIDHNGHLNVAYFVLAFDFATDAVYEKWGIGAEYAKQNGCSVFTLGMNVDYLKELFSHDKVEIKTQLLDWDYKRIHYFHTMLDVATGETAATNECLGMNVKLNSKRSASFPVHVQQKLADVYEENASSKKPKNYGRKLVIGDHTVLDVL